MENNSEWRHFWASIALDAFLEAWYGFKNPLVHRLLLVSATWLCLCALLTHAIAWVPVVLRAWGNLLDHFHAISGPQQRALEQAASDFLRYLYLPYQVLAAVRDFKNMPNRACLCGAVRADGTPATLSECCWQKKGNEKSQKSTPIDP